MRRLFLCLLACVLAGASGHPAAAAGGAAAGCPALKPQGTEINVTLTIAEPFYDKATSLKKLQTQSTAVREAWLKENGLQNLWRADELETAGVAEGAWGVSYEFMLDSVPYDRFGSYGCIFFKRLYVDLFYRTKITIPKEIAAKKCHYGIVNEHELMHHEANRKAVEIYVERLRGDLAKMVSQMEGQYVARDAAQARVESMQEGIRDAVNLYFNEAMAKKMNQLNSLIDTPQEYEIRTAMRAQCDQRR